MFSTRAQVLEVLWELAHLPTLPTSLVQQALEEHLGILSDAYAVKEAVKRNYIIKCIEDIKKVRLADAAASPGICCSPERRNFLYFPSVDSFVR